MRHVFAFALLASAVVVAGCTEEVGVTCPPGQTLCGQVCVYTTSDPSNCGSCGNVCQGQLICIGGQCTCQMGLTACGNQCVDTKSSVENCGSCGNACPVSQVCSMSACADSCSTGLTNCNRNCVDTKTDSSNCGGCGIICGQGEKCQAGVCKLECPVGQTICGGKCVNLVNDNNNCGACGNACPNNFFCVFGTCILGCPQPLTRCIPDGGNSDGGSQCIDTRFDPNNCGGCGGADVTPPPVPSAAPIVPHVCTVPPARNTNPVCDNSRCSAACEEGFNDCREDFSQQGGPQPVRRNPFMSYAPPSRNRRLAPAGENGPPPPDDMQCFDFTSNNCHCGGCEQFVNFDGDILPASFLIGWVPEIDATTGASICTELTSSAPREICCDSGYRERNQDFACGNTCADIDTCEGNPAGANCCEKPDHTGFACTDTGSDIHNCGGCNFNGFAGPFGPPPFPSNDCEMRPPIGPSPFPTCCGGGCADLNQETANCGSCGNNCGVVPSGSPQPSTPACCPNLVNRGPSMPSGGCVDEFNDINNCGSCGNVCNSGTDPACCFNGCVDLDTDSNNCGSCGNNCASFCGGCTSLGCGVNTPGTCACQCGS